MKKFQEIYLDKKYGEVKECTECYGSGIKGYDDECKTCKGEGFIKRLKGS